MKSDKFLKNFKTYNPNAWCKKSCDPDFTNMAWPCRGTLTTCQLPESDNLKTGADGKDKPHSASCWRFAFRFHQSECEATTGFMIQVEEDQGLGDGQKIETAMAKEVGLKVFRTYSPGHSWKWSCIEKISKAIEEWYASGCVNKDLENVWIGVDGSEVMATRPKYEKL